MQNTVVISVLPRVLWSTKLLSGDWMTKKNLSI